MFDEFYHFIDYRSMGEVIFGERKDTKQRVAIKKLQTERRGQDRLPYILREIDIISTSAHPCIVKYLDSYSVDSELWVFHLTSK